MKAGLIRLVFFSLLSGMGVSLVFIPGCSRMPPPSPSVCYEEGLEWGSKWSRGELEDYDLVRFIDELDRSDRESFQAGFVKACGQDGAERIAVLYDAVDSDEFEEGIRAGEKLRLEEITDEWIRDAMVNNQVKSQEKQLGWRCGFILGYKGATHSYEDGEAIYRSIESSIRESR